MSEKWFVSFGTRLSASDWKATLEQSPETLGKELAPSAGSPPKPMLASNVVPAVVPACSPRTNTSVLPFVSLGTRFDASELKATQVQSVSIDGRKRCAWLGPFGAIPF